MLARIAVSLCLRANKSVLSGAMQFSHRHSSVRHLGTFSTSSNANSLSPVAVGICKLAHGGCSLGWSDLALLSGFLPIR